MLIHVAVLVFFTFNASALELFENQNVSYCRKGYTEKARNCSCDGLGETGMQTCLDMTRHDQTIAAVIDHCPRLLPRGKSFGSTASTLFVNKMKKSFSTILSEERCNQMDKDTLASILSSCIDKDQPQFASIILKKCKLDDDILSQFLTKVNVSDKPAFQTVIQEGSNSGPNALLIAQYLSYRPMPQFNPATGFGAMGMSNGSNLNIGRGPFRQYNSPQASSLAQNPLNVYNQYLKAKMVASEPSILTKLQPDQAQYFGLMDNSCMGLTKEHFQQPHVSSKVVGNLPLPCFQQIPPKAFAGLTEKMIQRIKWWPFVSGEQMKNIPANKVILAVPFDQLGSGRQNRQNYRTHPCWNITKDQLKLIKNNRRVRKEYNRRCIKSSGNILKVSLAVINIPILLIFSFLIF